MDVFAALADPVRRALLHEIAGGPVRVRDLAELHPISRPAVSKHLRLLSDAGLVEAEDRGRERHYALVPAALAPVRELLDRLGAPSSGPVTGQVTGQVTGPVTGPVTGQALDALETEVRRTVRERRTDRPATTTATTATTATARQETA